MSTSLRGFSLRKAIDDKCRDCIYDPASRGTWRQQVTICPQTDCPLWPIRPLSVDAEAILGKPRDKHTADALSYLSVDKLLDWPNRGNQ